MLHKSRNKPNI